MVPTSSRRTGPAAVLTLALAACACGGYSSNGQNYAPQSYTYLAGTFVAGTDSGAMNVSVPLATLAHHGVPTAAMTPAGIRDLGPTPLVDPSAMGTVSVSGNLSVSGGASSAMTGTYTTGTGIFQATSASSAYSFAGTLQGAAIAGTVTGPNGSGPFLAGAVTAGNRVVVYCGTYTATGGAPTGKFDVVALTPTSGLLLQTDDTSSTPVFSGAVSIALPAGTIAITLPGQSSVYATGTTGTTSITGGTYNDGAGHAGTWSATQCAAYNVMTGGGAGGIY